MRREARPAEAEGGAAKRARCREARGLVLTGQPLLMAKGADPPLGAYGGGWVGKDTARLTSVEVLPETCLTKRQPPAIGERKSLMREPPAETQGRGRIITWYAEGGGVTVELDYPEGTSRWSLPVRGILCLPPAVVALFALLVVLIALPAGWILAVVSGRPQRAVYEGARNVFTILARVRAYFPLLVLEGYPLMSPQSLRVSSEAPATVNRVLVPLKPVFAVVGVCVDALAGVVMLAIGALAWLSILLLGRYPRRLFAAGAFIICWETRAMFWMVRDEWSLLAPPSLKTRTVECRPLVAQGAAVTGDA